jgi:hypothetical protein
MNKLYNYSFIEDDIGYKILLENKMIDQKIPYKHDIDPRLVNFLRTYYYQKINKIKKCTPLSTEFSISPTDIYIINKYLKKYSVNI